MERTTVILHEIVGKAVISDATPQSNKTNPATYELSLFSTEGI